MTELLKDALECNDYKIRLNFLAAGLMSEESNDTEEKFEQSRKYLNEILDFCVNYHGPEDRKIFIKHFGTTIEDYLKHVQFTA